MGNFGRKLNNFMSGRYGLDYFGAFLLVFGLILSIIGVIVAGFSVLAAIIIYVFVWVSLGFGMYRSYSRKIYQRSKENRAFMGIVGKIFAPIRLTKNRIRDRKNYIYRKCPGCRAVLRLPRTPGEHTVKCPKCSDRFNVKVK